MPFTALKLVEDFVVIAIKVNEDGLNPNVALTDSRPSLRNSPPSRQV